jgi:hypothetical protein
MSIIQPRRVARGKTEGGGIGAVADLVTMPERGIMNIDDALFAKELFDIKRGRTSRQQGQAVYAACDKGFLELVGNGGQRLLPADALPLPLSSLSHPFQRIFQPVRIIEKFDGSLAPGAHFAAV